MRRQAARIAGARVDIGTCPPGSGAVFISIFIFISVILSFRGWLPSASAGEERAGAWRLHSIDACGEERGADGTAVADLDGDGTADIACPWEQAAQVRLYLSAGGKPAWRMVAVTPDRWAGPVEDAALGDLDGDGRIDVLAASESGRIAICWSPRSAEDLGRAAAWKHEELPAAAAIRTAWMNVEAADVDGDGRLDIIAASKTKNAGLYWFRAPDDPRDLAAWRAHPIDAEISWAMSVIPADLDGDGDLDVLLSDRPSVVCWYEHPGADVIGGAPWKQHVIADEGGPYLWAHRHDLDGDGRLDLLVAVFAESAAAREDAEKTVIRWWRAPEDPRRVKGWERREIRVRTEDVHSGRHKALNAADLDGDGREEIVLTTEAPGDVYILRWRDSIRDELWAVENITGRRKGKYDTVDLLDLDGDGDLDILTSEEHELGVFWLENPLRRS
ncbi:MAG: VCBS repeat-containing protein [Planctomycetes bacterium]|nr:VCBS repeat-containing protein [Planctomycetota bacterium]